MLFYEPLFLFVFLPASYVLYLLAGARRGLRAAAILAASVFFYTWSEPLFVPIVLASAALDHWLARRIVATEDPRRARLLLTVGILANLAILLHYKYTAFLLANLDALLSGLSLHGIGVPAIALPIGVSFIVFEKISYLVDIQRRRSPPAAGFAAYLLYVFFFPKLLAGPIIKYHDLQAQIAAVPAAGMDDFAAGALRFMLGVVKKTMIAYPLGTGADLVFGDTSGPIGCANAWWGVALFTFEIYFDFSAYSDMAIGIARIFGFRLMENFNQPYIAASITEFWRRWHISLSTWIREYLYFPLGGNRVGAARQYGNLWLCFLASGLWHGAAWTYLAWGMYHGCFLVLERLFLLYWLRRAPPLVANALTFLVVMVGWTIFRAQSLAQAGDFLAAMVRPGLAGYTTRIWITPDQRVALLIAAVVCAVPRLPAYPRLRAAFADGSRRALVWQYGLAVLFAGAVGKALADPFVPFIYFRF
jgi:alginate O-acetyltransferase complex protein AlgI